ncbi:MAG TPA: prepilin-type N-terminal cleavage/methylation domain-containing protein [Patescibacteria group bacterium]|nr:prepilin-type N-terminal cleavage/methylation domain-containing protein [Patescibacteria group bacterium]
MKQISNLKSQNPNHKSKIINQSGFTLIEMLAVIIIFIVVGTIAVSILVTSFRTSTKTDVVTAVQNNGNYALSQMAKTIRDARGLVTPFPCSPTVVANTISITTPDNQEVTYACGNSTIASNGASLLDTTQVAVQACSFTCSQDSKSDLPVILIAFSLLQKSSSSFAEQKASQSAVFFQTSIGIRNINR